MLNWRLTCLPIALLAAVAALADEQAGLGADQTAAPILQGLRSPDPAARKRAEEGAAEVGAPIVAPLCELMAGDEQADIRAAEGALSAVVARAATPVTTEQRSAVTRALARELRRSESERVRAYVAQLLGIIGGDDAVPPLAAALRDDNTGQAALAALERIPGERATRALLNALKRTRHEQRRAVLFALGARRDRAAVKPLVELAWRSGRDVRAATLEALGQIGRRRAIDVVSYAARHGSEEVRRAAVNALLDLAEAQVGTRGAVARKLYQRAEASAVTSPQKEAALAGRLAIAPVGPD
jgi:HEAT repeat protein